MIVFENWTIKMMSNNDHLSFYFENNLLKYSFTGKLSPQKCDEKVKYFVNEIEQIILITKSSLFCCQLITFWNNNWNWNKFFVLFIL